MPHPPLQCTDASREKIAMLYGKCALNFQYYELALKKLLPRLDRTVVLLGEEAEQIAAKGTLGLLITAFREVAFSFEGQRQRETREPGPEKEPRLSIRHRFTQVFETEEHYAAQVASLEDLVRKRNYLVHHFLEDFDVYEEKGCLKAEQFLENLLLQTIEWLNELKAFNTIVNQASRELARRMADPNVSCRLFSVPPSNRDEWDVLDEVKALRDAEKLRAPDGFTDLANATAYLSSLGIAKDAFRQIGLSSWQQLVAESGCFEIIKRKDETSGKWVRWYRSKQLRAE